VMVDFYKGGSIHVLPVKIFIDEVMG
jgi:hypothetical protein